MDLEEFTLVDVEVVRFLSECEDRGIVIGSLPTLCSRVDSSRAGFERSLLSNSLSACLGQLTSKGESIGSRSVLDSTLAPVVRFRHLASVRHHGFDDNASLFNVLAVGIVPAYLFAKADLGGSMAAA